MPAAELLLDSLCVYKLHGNSWYFDCYTPLYQRPDLPELLREVAVGHVPISEIEQRNRLVVELYLKRFLI